MTSGSPNSIAISMASMAIPNSPLKTKIKTTKDAPRTVDPRALILVAQGFPLAKYLYDVDAPYEPLGYLQYTANSDAVREGYRALKASSLCGWVNRVQLSEPCRWTPEYLARWIGADGVVRICQCTVTREGIIHSIDTYDYEAELES